MVTAKIILKSAYKKFIDGTHRACAPDITDKNITQATQKSSLSVFDKLERIDSSNVLGIPIFAISHPDILNNWKTPNWGKGITGQLSKISGLMGKLSVIGMPEYLSI